MTKHQHVHLKVEKSIGGKEEKLLAILLPDGYEVAEREPGMLITTYVIREIGATNQCALASFYYSNGAAIRFTYQGGSVEGKKFAQAMNKEYKKTTLAD